MNFEVLFRLLRLDIQYFVLSIFLIALRTPGQKHDTIFVKLLLPPRQRRKISQYIGPGRAPKIAGPEIGSCPGPVFAQMRA
ncbi:MAG: hypothetical protein H6Q04_3509, partial [Acidobacteria bacterium]|nr:hypothetical protein [Acidobacteriota bacterium]